MKLTLAITLRSDATFGRGDGVVGLVDQEVEHDAATGLPVIRGRTIKGLLVEECANVLFALDRQASPALPDYQAAAGLLFGRAGSLAGDEGALRVGTAQLPEQLRVAVARLTAPANASAARLVPADVLDSLTGIRRQTAVDEQTGAPATGTLRAMRVVLRDTTLAADLTIDGDLSPDVLSLLAVCVTSVRRGGTGRNRGRGRLRCRLLDSAGKDVTTDYLAHFDGRVKPANGAPPPHEADAPVGAAEAPAAAADVTVATIAAATTPTGEGAPAPAASAPARVTDTSQRAILLFQVTLIEPVLATSLDGDPNSAVSFDFLPGSMLRGAILSRYLRHHQIDPRDFDPTAAESRRLFFDASTRYLNGYPVVHGGQRSLPTPLSLHRPKRELTPATDFAANPAAPPAAADAIRSGVRARHRPKRELTPATDFAANPAAEDDGTSWEQVRAPFSSLDGVTNRLTLLQPGRQVTVHTQRERLAGRPRRGSGAVYRYDALAPGQTFAAAILCQAADVATLATLLSGELWLGGSRTAGYGRVRLEYGGSMAWPWREAHVEEDDAYDSVEDTYDSDDAYDEGERDEDANSSGDDADDEDEPDGDHDADDEPADDPNDDASGEYARGFADDHDANTVVDHHATVSQDANGASGTSGDQAESEAAPTARLVVTLLSDCFLRDPTSGQLVVDAAVVRESIAAGLGLAPGALPSPRAYLRSRLVGGFNRAWGLPLPQMLATQMGSVVVFDEAPVVEFAQVRELEWQGIGERRAEGFGRLAVDWHGHASDRLEVDSWEPDLPDADALAADSPDARLAENMLKRLLRTRLDRALARVANQQGAVIRRPTPSQLARLRAEVQRALRMPPDDGRTHLNQYFDDLEKRQSTGRQFTRDRIGDRSLLAWLRWRAADTQQIWQDLAGARQALDPPAIGGVSAAALRDDNLAYEYNLRLIHEVLARAAKAKPRVEAGSATAPAESANQEGD